jgi:Na+-driven multidrug efflux pump
MDIIFFWIVFSLLVGALASKRGHGFWFGFLTSLVLSPLIVGIIVLIMDESKSRRAERIEDEERMRAAARAKIERGG